MKRNRIYRKQGKAITIAGFRAGLGALDWRWRCACLEASRRVKNSNRKSNARPRRALSEKWPFAALLQIWAFVNIRRTEKRIGRCET